MAPLSIHESPTASSMPVSSVRPFNRVSLSRQFQIVSGVLLAIGMSALGFWLTKQIETSSANRAASVSAAYVNSIISSVLQNWNGDEPLDDSTLASLDEIFVDGPLQRKVVRFKLWDGHGIIRYSNDHEQIGRRHPVSGLLADALGGTVRARLSELTAVDNAPERQQWARLLEVYVPLQRSGRVFAVAEFYHSTENLGREIDDAKRHAWWLLAATGAVAYLLLLGLIKRANDTILAQQRDLRDAGARTATLNEQFLQRIASDLHDGPAQVLAFVLMRFEELSLNPSMLGGEEGKKLCASLRAALDELRTIASGLPLPGIEHLSLAETAQRAVADGIKLWGKHVNTEVSGELGDAAQAVKITLYRIIQESLANSWHHAPESIPDLRIAATDAGISITVEDAGKGFDIETAKSSGRLGLSLMRERVRMLGGDFSISSSPDNGTRIDAFIPYSQPNT